MCILSKLIQNIRLIMIWYFESCEVDPSRLLCINSILILSLISIINNSIIVRLTGEFYSLFGFILSGFYNNPTNDIWYLNIEVY